MQDNHYVVYSGLLDAFVKVKKFKREEIDSIFKILDSKISLPSFNISDFYTFIAKEGITNFKTLEKVHGKSAVFVEALYEGVTEVYPMLTADVACKHFNAGEESEEEEQGESHNYNLVQLQNIKKKIETELIGQQEAIDASFDTFKLINSGFESFSSLFFIGPTGVGKTELGKLIAKHYMKDKNRLLKINCGEYSNQHEYAKLIGSPPGYIGYNEKGILSERASESSKWIILFDEIEKANSKLHNLLLGLLDDGVIVDSHGVELNFKNSLFLFTSNVGIKDVVGKKLMGFNNAIVSYDDARETISDAFKNEFSPEFINRIDNVIFFNSLTKVEVEKIVKLNLKNLPLTPNKKLINFILEGGYSQEYGARNVKRFIKQNVTLKIADKILDGEDKKTFKAKVKKGELEIL
jgi:ATP-dependent Clp protease ATP-binding subunit ClpA